MVSHLCPARQDTALIDTGKYSIVCDSGVTIHDNNMVFCYGVSHVCNCLGLHDRIQIVDLRTGCLVTIAAPPALFTTHQNPVVVWVDATRIDIPVMSLPNGPVAPGLRNLLTTGARWVASAFGRTFSTVDPVVPSSPFSSMAPTAAPLDVIRRQKSPQKNDSSNGVLLVDVERHPHRYDITGITMWSGNETASSDDSVGEKPGVSGMVVDDDTTMMMSPVSLSRQTWYLICAYLLQWDDIPLYPSYAKMIEGIAESANGNNWRFRNSEIQSAARMVTAHHRIADGDQDLQQQPSRHRRILGITDVYLYRVALASTQCNVLADAQFWTLATRARFSTLQDASRRHSNMLTSWTFGTDFVHTCVVNRNPFLLRRACQMSGPHHRHMRDERLWDSAARGFLLALRIHDVEMAHLAVQVLRVSEGPDYKWSKTSYGRKIMTPTLSMLTHMCDVCARVFVVDLGYEPSKTALGELERRRSAGCTDLSVKALQKYLSDRATIVDLDNDNA